jgi:cytochrome c5
MPVRLAAIVTSLSIVSLAGQAPAATRSVHDGVYTVNQALKGAALYRRFCEPCHGADLLGGAAPLPGRRPGVVPSLRGGEFAAKYALMN